MLGGWRSRGRSRRWAACWWTWSIGGDPARSATSCSLWLSCRPPVGEGCRGSQVRCRRWDWVAGGWWWWWWWWWWCAARLPADDRLRDSSGATRGTDLSPPIQRCLDLVRAFLIDVPGQQHSGSTIWL